MFETPKHHPIKENTMSTRNILIGGTAAFLAGSIVAVLVVFAIFGSPS